MCELENTGKYLYINKKNGEEISTNMEEDELLERLEEVGKGDFPKSLLSQHKEKGFLSEAQWYWVVKIVSEADELFPCDTKEIFARLQKGPLWVKFKELQIDMKIYQSGVIYLNGERFGKYTEKGLLVPGCKNPDVVNKFLLVFCREGVDSCMQRIGKRTGICCYCGITLTHDISIGMGYGPICADKHGLPFPMEEYNKSLAARRKNGNSQ